MLPYHMSILADCKKELRTIWQFGMCSPLRPSQRGLIVSAMPLLDGELAAGGRREVR